MAGLGTVSFPFILVAHVRKAFASTTPVFGGGLRNHDEFSRNTTPNAFLKILMRRACIKPQTSFPPSISSNKRALMEQNMPNFRLFVFVYRA